MSHLRNMFGGGSKNAAYQAFEDDSSDPITEASPVAEDAPDTPSAVSATSDSSEQDSSSSSSEDDTGDDSSSSSSESLERPPEDSGTACLVESIKAYSFSSHLIELRHTIGSESLVTPVQIGIESCKVLKDPSSGCNLLIGVSIDTFMKSLSNLISPLTQSLGS